MHLIFTTPILEHPPAGGPQLRIENSIKALQTISSVHLLSRVRKKALGGNEGELFYRGLSHSFLYMPSVQSNLLTLIIRVWNKILRIFSQILKKWQWQKFILKYQCLQTKRDAKFLVQYAKTHHISVVWFGYGNISFALMQQVHAMAPDLKLICDTDSVWSRFILRELPYQKDPERCAELYQMGQEKEQEEEAWVSFCNVTAAVSEVDQTYYQSIADDAQRIKIFSNVLDIANYTVVPARSPDLPATYLYLAGTFGPRSAMDQAARWVIQEIWPALAAQFPALHFYIMGSGSDTTLQDIHDPRIHIKGKLPSLLPYLFHSTVALVPLKFESGTRFKILEAGACKIPVVSTTLGAEGIPVTDGKDILIADTPETFIAAITKILENPSMAKTLAENLQQLVIQKYSIAALAQEGKDILTYLGCDTKDL